MSVDKLFNALQTLSQRTNEAHEPSDYVLGVVVSASPLTIKLEQGDELSGDFLVLTDLVRDYSVDIEVSHTTENRAGGAGDAAFESHNHDYKGRKKITVYNALKVGESVIMLKQAGGQQFVVLSRLYDHTELSGQWG